MQNPQKESRQSRETIEAITGYLLTLCLTFFFIQAHRDILISPGGFNAIKYIVYILLFAPLLAGVLNLLPLQGVLMFLGAAATLAGRFLLLQPSVPSYYWGEYLTIGGYIFFFVSSLMYLTGKHQGSRGARFPIAMFTAGFISAALLHLTLRMADKVQSNGIILFLIVVGAITLILVSVFPSGTTSSSEGAGSKKRRSIVAGFSIFLIAVPIHYIFQWMLKPELFSGVADVSYRASVIGVKAALCAAIAAAVGFAVSRTIKRFATILCILSVFAMFVFGFLFKLPPGAISLILIVCALAVIAFSLTPILIFFSQRIVPCRALFLGLGTAATTYATFGLYIHLLEHHAPLLHWAMAGFLAVGLILIAAAGREVFMPSGERVSAGSPKMGAAIAIIVALCLLIYNGTPQQRDISGAGRKVLASLYTWYGTPGKPLGEFGMETFIRPAAETTWQLDGSTAENLTTTVKELMRGMQPFIVLSAKSDGADKNRIVLSSEAPTEGFNLNSRYYFIFRAQFAGGDADVEFFVRQNGVRYVKQLEPVATGGEYRAVFPTEFKNAAEQGANAMGFSVSCPKAGRCDFAVSELKVSRWHHWDEDYHATQINGVWYNDPPETLAAAHKANYSGQPWSEIAPYSPDGYYDSWDPTVVRSQLQLMEKAGIDLIMIMHPGDIRIVEMILDTLEELNSPLQIVYWHEYGFDAPTSGENFIKRFGSHPRFFKINGKPVWIVGSTGLQEKPYKVYERDFARLHRETNAFMIGDQYSPPKEEMMSILDGHYYYDTTGLYRARWGATNIKVAQPDGHFVTGYGDMDILFRSIANIVHARNQIYIATIIPGFDNVSVHGFERTPLYDGRPGTIVERHDGLTYAETWKAAIRSGADWACIVSWNELHEGTEIEPTKEDGVYYIKETARWAEIFRSGKDMP
ncbi:MAG: hypothetical protein AB1546_12295 [bacterium]